MSEGTFPAVAVQLFLFLDVKIDTVFKGKLEEAFYITESFLWELHSHFLEFG